MSSRLGAQGLHAEIRDELVAMMQRIGQLHESHLQTRSQLFARFLKLLDASRPIQPSPSDSLGDSAGDTIHEHSVFDPAREPWVLEHCPTYTIPVVPGAWMLDRLAAFALTRRPGQCVSGVRNFVISGWLYADRTCHLRTSCVDRGGDEIEVTLSVWQESRRGGLGRYRQTASGHIRVGSYDPIQPPPLPELLNAAPADDTYEDTFLGPAFQILFDARTGKNGGSGWLDLDRSGIPSGVLHQGALDGLLHLCGPRAVKRWCPDLDPIWLPRGITEARFYAPPPKGGIVRCELRIDHSVPEQRASYVRVQLLVENFILLETRSVNVTLPTRMPISAMRQFFRERRYVDGAAYSRMDHTHTRLSAGELAELDWLRGTAARIYGLDPELDLDQLTQQITMKDHAARRLRVHPCEIVLSLDPPFAEHHGAIVPLRVEFSQGEAVVTDG